MKKSLKKIASMSLCAAMVMGTLAGCSSGSSDAAATTAATTAAAGGETTGTAAGEEAPAEGTNSNQPYPVSTPFIVFPTL